MVKRCNFCILIFIPFFCCHQEPIIASQRRLPSAKCKKWPITRSPSELQCVNNAASYWPMQPLLPFRGWKKRCWKMWQNIARHEHFLSLTHTFFPVYVTSQKAIRTDISAAGLSLITTALSAVCRTYWMITWEKLSRPMKSLMPLFCILFLCSPRIFSFEGITKPISSFSIQRVFIWKHFDKMLGHQSFWFIERWSIN